MKTRTSISHFSNVEQQALGRLKNKIVELYNPLIIYHLSSNLTTNCDRNCFTYPRRKEHSSFSCDLLIVLPNNTTTLPEIVQDLKKIDPIYNHIYLITHPIDFVIQHLKNYCLFFCWVQRNAIVLYNRENAIDLLPEPISNIKIYQRMAEQLFISSPKYNNYTQVTLSPPPFTKVLKPRYSITIVVPHI